MVRDLKEKITPIPGQTRAMKKMPWNPDESFWNESFGWGSFRRTGHSLGKYIAYKLGCDGNDGNGLMATHLESKLHT